MRGSVRSAYIIMLVLHGAGEFAACISVFDVLALVVLFVTAGNTDDQLGVAALADEQAQGHDGESGGHAGFLQLCYLFEA